MTQITNTRAIILGNMEGKGDLMLKPASKTGHETIFLRKGTTTVFHKIADSARGIKKADAQLKDFLDTKKSGGSTLQHIKSFLDDNKTYEFTKNKDVVFMSTPLSIADIKNTEQLKERSIVRPTIILDKTLSDGIEIEKNIRAYLLKSLNNETLDISDKAIESTAAKFKTNVKKLLSGNELTRPVFSNAKALVVKYFDTLPQDIKTKLIELHPTLLDNKQITSFDQTTSDQIKSSVSKIDSGPPPSTINVGQPPTKIDSKVAKNQEDVDRLQATLRDLGLF